MNTKQRAAFLWWDCLTISQKAWYGQMYPYKNAQEIIFSAYDEYIKNKGHLRVVK